MPITLEPIAWVRSARAELLDDDWDAVAATIELADDVPGEALDGIETFSHVEVLYHFDKVAPEKIARAPRHRRAH